MVIGRRSTRRKAGVWKSERWILKGTRLGGRYMEGWRIESSCVLGYLEFRLLLALVCRSFWVIAGLVVVSHACIVKSGQGEARFAGVFVLRVLGDGLRRRQIT